MAHKRDIQRWRLGEPSGPAGLPRSKIKAISNQKSKGLTCNTKGN